MEETNKRLPRHRIICRFTAILLFATSIFAWFHLAGAQQPPKVPRIGFLAITPGTPNILAFQRGLLELGYIEGKNILVEYRWTEGKDDLIPSFVAELVQLKVDVLVSPLVPAIRAAKESTRTIPIVMVINDDPVAIGIVDSLARPGGNVTGLTRLTQELNGKRLELLKEVVPKASRVGVLLQAPSTASASAFREYETVARALKIPVQFCRGSRSEP